MRKTALITGVLVAVMVMLAAAGSVCNAVWQMATCEDFYNGMSRDAVARYLNIQDDPQADQKVTEYIGLTSEKQEFFAAIAREYMLGEDQSVDLPVYVSLDEVRHMLDVRGLIWRTRDVGKMCMTLAAVLAMAIAWTGAGLRRRLPPRLAGHLGAFALMGALAGGLYRAVQGGAFERLFIRMHELLFTNDLWKMDPQKHILIRIMPQPLFERAFFICAKQALQVFLCTWVMLVMIDWVVSGMIRRHMKTD